jgi:hypothetical protein
MMVDSDRRTWDANRRRAVKVPLQIFVVGGTKLSFVQDSDLIGNFIVLGFDFLREPKPSFRHHEEERLSRGVLDLLGHAQAFGCVAAMILGAGH